VLNDALLFTADDSKKCCPLQEFCGAYMVLFTTLLSFCVVEHYHYLLEQAFEFNIPITKQHNETTNEINQIKYQQTNETKGRKHI